MTLIDPALVRLAFYESSEGPRIMIFGSMCTNLQAVQECFHELSEEKCNLELGEQSFVFVAGDIRLRLRSSDDFFEETDGESMLGLRRIENEQCSFIWTRTKEGWDYLAKLIAGMISAKHSGHQYLTNFPDDDAIVVVSKGEYGDEVIQR